MAMIRVGRFYTAIVTSAIALTVASPVRAADTAKGGTLFLRCAACHSTKPGVRMMGPSLAGIVGRKAGTAPGFSYSVAMKNYGKIWNAKTLDPYLAKPSSVVPGTKMIFMGLPNPTDRANLIAYLQTLK